MAFETNTAVLGTVATRIIPDRKFPAGPKSLVLTNYGPATFTAGVVEWSNDLTTWGTADGTTFQTLGSASQAWSYFTDGRPYLRVTGAVASGSVATCVWSINY